MYQVEIKVEHGSCIDRMPRRLAVVLQPNGVDWELFEPFVYITRYDLTIVVPAGFKTDFGSVPRLYATYALFGNVGHEAATVHDFCYRRPLDADVSREVADEIFHDALLDSGVARWKARLMWLGVRIGGHRSYRTDLIMA